MLRRSSNSLALWFSAQSCDPLITLLLLCDSDLAIVRNCKCISCTRPVKGSCTALAYNVILCKTWGKDKKGSFFLPKATGRPLTYLRVSSRTNYQHLRKKLVLSSIHKNQAVSKLIGCPYSTKTPQALKVGFNQTWDLSNVFLIHYLGSTCQKHKGRVGDVQSPALSRTLG